MERVSQERGQDVDERNNNNYYNISYYIIITYNQVTRSII